MWGKAAAANSAHRSQLASVKARTGAGIWGKGVVVNGHGSHGNGSWGACSTVGGVAPVVCQVMNLGVAAAGLQQLEGDWLVGCGSNDAHAGLRARSTLRVGC